MSGVIESAGSASLAAISAPIAHRIYNHIMTVRDARLSLRGKENRSRRSLVDTIRTAFGHEDLLDKETAAVLSETFLKSRYLPYFVDAALVGFVPENALLSFSEYIEHQGTSEERASEIAGNIWLVIRAIIERSLKSLNILEPSSHFQALKGEVRKFDLALASSRANAGLPVASRSASPARLNDLRGLEDIAVEALKNNVRDRLNKINVHASDGDLMSVYLDDVYVDPPLGALKHHPPFFRYRDIRDRASFHPTGGGWSRLLHAVRSSNVVLLGDPGGGKSTITKKVALEVAKDTSGPEKSLIPVYVQLRAFHAARLKGEASLLDFIQRQWKDVLGFWSDDDIRFFLYSSLTNGSVMVVFDGLDEILEDSKRNFMSAEISNFANTFPLTSIVTTCRFVGYDKASIEEFQHFGVMELSEPLVGSMFEKVITNVLKHGPQVASSKREEFVEEAFRSAPDIIVNPLLCTLVITMYSKKQTIPTDRYKLYEYCADLLIKHWDGFRQIKPDLPLSVRVYDLVMHIAAILYDQERYGGNLNKAQLTSEAKQFFMTEYIDNRTERACQAADSFVKYLTDRAWILHEVGADVFEFTHRTFLEFFYARHLDTTFETIDQLLEKLLPWAARGGRQLPSHLALQAKTAGNRKRATDAARILADSIEINPTPPLAVFGAQFLRYGFPQADELNKLVSVIISASESQEDMNAVISLLANESEASGDVLGLTLKKIDTIDSVSRMKLYGEAFDYLRGTSSPFKNVDEVSSAFCKLKNVVKKKSASSQFAFWLNVDFFFDLNKTGLDRFSLRLWDNSSSRLVNNRAPADSQRMLFSLFCPDKLYYPAQEKIYTQIASHVFSKKFAKETPIRIINRDYGLGYYREFEDWDGILAHKDSILASRVLMFSIENAVHFCGFDWIEKAIICLKSLAKQSKEVADEVVYWGRARQGYTTGADSFEVRALAFSEIAQK